LGSNNIRSITQDKNQNIWVGTDKGLNLLIDSISGLEIDKTAENNHFCILQYNFDNGLKDSECNQNSILCDSENRLWVGTRKSLSMIDVDKLSIKQTPIDIQFDRVEINEEFVDFNNPAILENKKIEYESVEPFSNIPIELHLKHDYNHLTFYYSAKEFKSPQNIKYSYKIDGLNKNWSIPTSQAQADYQNLPKGKHTFMLKAKGQNQLWSQVLEYTFVIKPPWWETYLAFFSYSLICILLVYYIIRWRTQKLKQRKDELVTFVEELQKAKKKAEESEKLKSAFLLNLSHEIRTPMNGIMGFSSLLNQKGLSGEEQNHYIKYIKESGNRMLNTVTNLVQISRIETGLVELSMKRTNLIEKALEICAEFVEKAEEKSLKLNYDSVLNAIEFEVETDISKFETVLKHLINNAIKYTNKGTVEIGFQKVENSSGLLLEFYVKDTGEGIPSQRQEAIFNRFEQADIEDKQAKQGTGIGLSIAEAYIKMLDGKIWLQSEKGKGSTFFFTLPVKSIDYNLAKNINQQKLQEKKEQKFKILIAEDDEISYLHLSILLNPVAKQIIHTTNGKETIEVLKSNPDIDLVLMDIKMPVMSGIEATREIRGFNKNVVIIAQTAHVLSGDREKVIQAGCNDYITKPIQKDKLFILIKNYLLKEI
jgi:signal transduction histidine kinase/CheY-like chemotaxis protein